MGSSDRCWVIAGAPEDLKVCVGGSGAEEGKVGSGGTNRFSG
jgi:hypothetical protein